VLTADTLGLLHDARFKSKQQVLEMIARHAPKPDVPDSIRRSPRPSARAPHVQGTLRPGALSPPNLVPAPARTPSVVIPLSPERHKISFTASQRVRDMLEQAQDLRRHRYPAGDLEPLFERALELLLADEQRRRFAQTAKPRTPSNASNATGAKHSRYIPNAVRRQVWARDGGRCCFEGPDNTRCGARGPLEFHHVVPFARGGAMTADNIVLLCRSHNALFAERDYGRDFMRARIAGACRTMSGGSSMIRGLDTA
jgi:5-methylcytosine-specific restriction endonuclease McrA